MLTPRKWLTLLVMTAVAVGITTSCIQLPTAPSLQVSGTTAAPQKVIQTGSLLGDIGTILNDATSLITKTLDISGSVGGTLTNGRWTVAVPPDAVSGSATVSIDIPNPVSPACQLEITPATSNHFAVPVELTVDCSSVPAEKLKTFSIFWYDPSTSKWVPVANSTVDLQHKTVSAPLQHFSKYGVGPLEGRASW